MDLMRASAGETFCKRVLRSLGLVRQHWDPCLSGRMFGVVREEGRSSQFAAVQTSP